MYAQNNGYYMPNYNPYMQQGNGAMPDMLNQFKGQYQGQPMQNIQPGQVQLQSQQPQIQNIIQPKPLNDIIWVLNESEATAYPVAPNNSVVLWDKNDDTIYIKSANAQGVPSMRILDFVERTENKQKTYVKEQKNAEPHECKCNTNMFATKEQIRELWAKIEEITSTSNEVIAEKPKAKSAKSKGDAE